MDDEELVRETAGEMLIRMGYEVEFARDSKEHYMIPRDFFMVSS